MKGKDQRCTTGKGTDLEIGVEVVFAGVCEESVKGIQEVGTTGEWQFS